jgi:hypothetical protein
MEVISVAPKYIPLIQKPKCCAVACLQMVLYRNGFGLFDQEDLAIQFGVKIGADDKPAFREDMPIMTEFNNDEGISTISSVDRINGFFRASGIALMATAFPFAQISEFKDLLTDNLSQNNDVWVEYHTHEIYADDANNKRIHDALVESIDPSTNTAIIIDPSPRRRQRVKVSIEVLERSMSASFGQELGLLLIKKKTA